MHILWWCIYIEEVLFIVSYKPIRPIGTIISGEHNDLNITLQVNEVELKVFLRLIDIFVSIYTIELSC